MNGEIVALRWKSGNPGGCGWCFEGGQSFTLASTVAGRLGLGQQLEPAEIEHLQQLDGRSAPCSTALRLLCRRPRSEQELRLALQRRRLGEADSEAVMERLRQGGWLDDAAFARAWIENRAGLPSAQLPGAALRAEAEGRRPGDHRRRPAGFR